MIDLPNLTKVRYKISTTTNLLELFICCVGSYMGVAGTIALVSRIMEYKTQAFTSLALMPLPAFNVSRRKAEGPGTLSHVHDV